MTKQRVVDHQEWEKQHTALLEKEKKFSRLRDELTKARQELPWEMVEKDYIFETVSGPKHLSELFDGRHQLLVYQNAPKNLFLSEGEDVNLLKITIS